MSMKPGATYLPSASMMRPAFEPWRRPTRATTEPRTPTSAARAGAPVPSRTRPFRIRTSKSIGPVSIRTLLTACTSSSGSIPPVRSAVHKGSWILAGPRIARTTNRLYYASVRARTLRYHAHVGGRTPSVSSADEEVRAGLGSREATHPIRCEQQLPRHRAVPDVRPQGAGLTAVGRRRERVRRLQHGLRGARRGTQPPGPRESDAPARVEWHHLRIRIRRRGPARGSSVPALPHGPPEVLHDGSRRDPVRGPAGPRGDRPSEDPQVRGMLPRIPRLPDGLDQAAKGAFRGPEATERRAFVQGPAEGTRRDRDRRSLQRRRCHGVPRALASRRRGRDHPRAGADEHGLRPAGTRLLGS